MKKLLTVLCAMGLLSADAQTLFTYGKEAVSAEEFNRAFDKNNNGVRNEKALKEYLDLYIASRLKISEARDLHLDTLPQLKMDLANLREQILPAYLTDKGSLDRMVNEAFARMQKDIRVAHIFIAFTKNGRTDKEAAAKRRDEMLAKLQKGASFEAIAKEFSDDPSAQTNGGDLGWITVFTLPYELENAVYTTAQGKLSAVHASAAGYHLFKNLGERKALGRMKAAQLLLAFPPGTSDAAKAKMKKTADSLYNRLLAKDDFGKLAAAFSNDVISAANNGQMGEFGVGEYSKSFEQAVFALVKDGAISKPFVTEHGYHIVKRLEHIPAPAKLTDLVKADLQQRVEGSDRMQVTKAVLAQKVLQQAGFKKLLASDNELWAYSDSALSVAMPSGKITINASTPVLQVGDHNTNVQDWLAFAYTHRYKANGGTKPYTQVWEEFVQDAALQYYKDHLEEFNEEFKRQVTEFAEGNLFFEIMQRQVWTPAQSDTVALANYYTAHKGQYVWKPSADAVLFYATDAAVATAFHKAVQKSGANWKTIVNQYSEQITADSGRFELGQLPKAAKDVLKEGAVTTPVVNKTDNTVSMAYIIRVYTKEEPRNFTDAKGLVINDYQAELERRWVEDLKKKYPVKVDEGVWRKVVNSK